jgi:hypothetical protein
LPKAIGAGDLAVEFGFEVVDGGGSGFYFGDDLVLFGERGQTQLDCSNVIKTQSNFCCAPLKQLPLGLRWLAREEPCEETGIHFV